MVKRIAIIAMSAFTVALLLLFSLTGISCAESNRTLIILDTGIDYTHEDLGNYIGGYDFVNNDTDPTYAALASNTAEKVIITEIYYDTYLSGDTDGEFIRIHNPTGSTINIGGWQITDGEGVITFPSWASIDAGESLYLAYNATAFHDEMLQRRKF